MKYFNSLDVWKLVPARAGQQAGRRQNSYDDGGGGGGYNAGGPRGGGGGGGRGNYGGGSDPRADLVVPRDYDGRTDEPSNDDIPF